MPEPLTHPPVSRPRPPRRLAAVPDLPGRFSPLTAQQRAALEGFCAEARPWALRQARRTYRHLPDEQRHHAVASALRQLTATTPPALDRRTLYAELSQHLTESLRQAHAGWCLDQAQATWRHEGPTAVPQEREARSTAHAVAGFVEEGLAGLERAVLQLEIGARRDTRTVRAALRLGPRQYKRHREQGLTKLRAAIAGQAAGHVCDHHLQSVTLAATGDGGALDALSTGADRCRACAREAAGLKRMLEERLALAPWPLAVKPAGIVATKLGAAAAAVGGKSAGTAGLGALTGTGPGAGVMASMIAAAVVATGTTGMVESRRDRPTATPAAPSVAATAAASAAAPAEPAAPAAKRVRRSERSERGDRRRASTRRADQRQRQRRDATATTPAQTAPVTTATAAPTTTARPGVRDTVGKTVDGVRKVADPVVKKLPKPVAQPVQDTLQGTQDALDRVTGTLDGLLAPQK